MRRFLVEMPATTVDGKAYEPEDIAIAIVSGGPFAVAAVDEISERDGHVAKNWAEEMFPAATGSIKAMLILAYGSGLDRGLAEAMMLVREAMEQVTEQ